MQKKIRKLAISAIAALASALTMSAQEIENYLFSSNYQPSVETVQMARYGRVSHSLNTGAMHQVIPLLLQGPRLRDSCLSLV